MHRPDAPVVLHSSLVTLSLSVATPLILLTIGVYSLTLRVWAPTIIVTGLGAALAVVVLFDLPLRSEFDADGVTRVCILRRQRLDWGRVVAVERALARPPLRRSGEADEPRPAGARRSQGFVARLGPRRVSMLVDRRESLREYDAVAALLRPRATRMRATPPPLDSVPAGRGRRSLHHEPRDG